MLLNVSLEPSVENRGFGFPKTNEAFQVQPPRDKSQTYQSVPSTSKTIPSNLLVDGPGAYGRLNGANVHVFGTDCIMSRNLRMQTKTNRQSENEDWRCARCCGRLVSSEMSPLSLSGFRLNCIGPRVFCGAWLVAWWGELKPPEFSSKAPPSRALLLWSGARGRFTSLQRHATGFQGSRQGGGFGGFGGSGCIAYPCSVNQPTKATKDEPSTTSC